MLVMTGASASGKTEIAKIIITKYNFKKMVTYTTRPMREGEVDGLDYHFITFSQFSEKLKNRDFLETTQYNNNYYGTAFRDAQEDKVLIVDTFGANVLHEQLKNKVTLFFLEAPKNIRTHRMQSRGDDPYEIEKRLIGDDKFFKRNNMIHIDFIIDTSQLSLEQLADQIYTLYIKHRKKEY